MSGGIVIKSRGTVVERHNTVIKSFKMVIDSHEMLLDSLEMVTGSQGRFTGRDGMECGIPGTLRADSGDCAEPAKFVAEATPPGAEGATGWSSAAERGAVPAKFVGNRR